MSEGELVRALVDWLNQRTDCHIEPGLDDDEVDLAEAEFGIRMPSIWRRTLALAHPVALPRPTRSPDGVLRWTRYPDWRLRDLSGTRRLVEGPTAGLLFDVEHNDFWWRAWGERPERVIDRLSVARVQLAAVPRLTPLWGNLYVASEDDSPVFSIVQADLYIPALTLGGLLDDTTEEQVATGDYPIGNVPFWSELHAYSQIGHGTSFGNLAHGGL